jgi:hypothetical protein
MLRILVGCDVIWANEEIKKFKRLELSVDWGVRR